MEKSSPLVAAAAAAATRLDERSERGSPPSPKAAPWLVFPHNEGKKDHAFYNICEPNNRTCRKFIPEMHGKSYWQKPSYQGWLVMVCDDKDNSIASNSKFGDCFLWNPVSLETIQLPTLLNWLDKLDQFWIRECVLTSPQTPSANPGDIGSMVLFLFQDLYDYRQVLVFCRPRQDKQWRTMNLSGYMVNYDIVESLVYFKGKLYGMCNNKRHLEIDIQLGLDDNGDETLAIRSFNISDDTFFPMLGGEYSNVETHFVESRDEIFMIKLVYNPRSTEKIVVSIQVRRLDFSSMAWETVKSLGDHVIFLGTNTTASCSAADLGLSRGCFYYILPDDQSLYRFEVEDIAHTVSLPCVKLPTPLFSGGWMMMPTTVRVEDGRRRRRREIEEILGNDDEEEYKIVEARENKTSMNNDETENPGQKQSGGESEEARPWGILYQDTVALIASYLHPVDYVHFRAVSTENRSIIPTPWSCRSSSVGTTYLSPWMVFRKNSDTIYNFLDPMYNEKYLMNHSELLVGATIRYSKGGWLLMTKGGRHRTTLFFYNPFTKAMIQLPDLQDTYSFVGVSVSSLPTSSDCVVFGIDLDFVSRVSIFVIARGNDIWRSHIFENVNLEKYMPCVNNPVFYEGAFYCLDYNGTLGVFRLEDGSWEVLAKPQGIFDALCPSFLVKCDGKLLLVDIGHLGKSIGIFRLDFSKMEWVKVESLGKYMLFISNTSCLAAIAPNSLMENKIYFAKLHCEKILYYSLDTGMYHTSEDQHSAKDFYDTTESFNCTWIEPNWSQTTEKELDWLSV